MNESRWSLFLQRVNFKVLKINQLNNELNKVFKKLQIRI